MSFEVIVNLIFFNSSFVPMGSDTRMRVPSERTTCSSGDIKNANGRAMDSMIKKAM